MSTLARLEGTTVDLSALTPAEMARIGELHGNIDRGDHTLECMEAGGGEMFIRRRGDRYFAVHFSGSGCSATHDVAPETDEHKRQKEYWCRAADRVGYEAVPEYKTNGGTRVDVLVKGTVLVGAEVQHSRLKLTAARSRTTKTANAGIVPLWTSDSQREPTWLHKIPSIRVNDTDWSAGMPPAGTATATALREIEMTRCDWSGFQKCPVTGGRPCGDWHPKLVPLLGITLDDAIAGAASGNLLPIVDRSGHVYIVPQRDRDKLRQEGECDWSPTWQQQQKPDPKQDRRTCEAAIHRGIAVSQTAIIGPVHGPAPLCPVCRFPLDGAATGLSMHHDCARTQIM
ncbi:hypothetical protein RR21198_5877 [Rhodococcus rhodochrous ATCC 21198]|uniref:hypothetical protein n=1 Tax=Rhodococcus aetherivorans TaxID=191292 RepID=UPI0003E29812|nr:hypothetical protein [Rhodococcus aetherivorans]ETT28762.1 hypothetical protein RR21198_5877 [Rhodococcus rhodochrous ATCC 21198]NGP26402.1 hypothetical protein [Rhodococcus aetherivorans]